MRHIQPATSDDRPAQCYCCCSYPRRHVMLKPTGRDWIWQVVRVVLVPGTTLASIDPYGPTTIPTVMMAFLGWQLLPIGFQNHCVCGLRGFFGPSNGL